MPREYTISGFGASIACIIMEEIKCLPETNCKGSLGMMYTIANNDKGAVEHDCYTVLNILQERFKLCESSPSSDGLDLLPF